ncbi:MAG TPA: ferritin-like domain-containing protein [Kofleriaceae bacterium]|nr:ferritin-like domain-containing protein [Kofleriaceae bacterium]
METKEKIKSEISKRFTRDLLASALGRAYVLTQAAVAEGSDESAVFDRLLPVVDDPQLQKAIATHKADEERHAKMFEACVQRQGVAPITIPASHQLLPLIREEMGGFDAPNMERTSARWVAGPIKTHEDIMNTYLVLQVIEERAIEQFTILHDVIGEFDPESAAVIAQIMADEERHLKYCAAITKRYAPSPAALEAGLRTYRDAEARAFRKQQQLTGQTLLAMPVMPKYKRWVWRAVLDALRPLTEKVLPYTRAGLRAQVMARSASPIPA